MRLSRNLGAVLLAGVLCSGPANANMVLGGAAGGGGTPPVNTQGPTVSGSIATAATNAVSCTTGTWTNSPTSYTYQWYRDGSTAIGTNSANYTTVAGDLGHLITCKVTAANGAGSGSASPASNPAGNCAQSSAWFGRVWLLPATLDGTLGTSSSGIVSGGTAHLTAYDTMICNLVTDTVWSTLDALWVPATADATSNSAISQSIANLNLVSSSFPLVLHGSPAFALNAGYTGGSDIGSGVTVWIDTGFNPSSGSHQYAVANAHMMAWTFTSYASSSNYPAILGAQDASNATLIMPEAAGTALFMQLNASASGLANKVVSTSAGSFVASRYNATSGINSFFNGGLITLNSTPSATAIPTVSQYLLAENVSGTASNGGPYQIATASFGSSLASTTPPAVSSSGGTSGSGLVPRLCAYLTTVHGSC